MDVDSASGVQVVSCSSMNPAHPPSATLDGDAKTFWLTTGMFPQEVTFAVPKRMTSTIVVTTLGVKSIEASFCDKALPTSFVPLAQVAVPAAAAASATPHQSTLSFSAISPRFVRLSITGGMGPFAAVSAVDIH